MKIILATLLTVLIGFQASGEAPADSVRVFFRAGHSRFDPALGDNRAVMDSFIEEVRKAYEANLIDSIVVRGFASPDGTSTANVRLSLLRCNTIAELIEKQAAVSPVMIRTIPEGVAWGELRRLVYENPAVPSREKVLDILDNVPLWIRNSKGAIADGRKKRLMELERGDTYRWLLANIFPQLRNAVAIALYARKADASEDNDKDSDDFNREPASRTDMSETADRHETIKDIQDEPEPSEPASPDSTEETSAQEPPAKEPGHFHMAVKTNMLFDAALVPNIGAEFYLGNNISLYGEWMYAWWDNDRRHDYWRTYGGDLGVRWWFGGKAHAKPLTGHHLGIYAGLFTFDFELGEAGYMGGKPGGTLWDRYLINAGIEYGYSLPVARRLNIDFSIGLGYFAGNYIKYYPFDNDYYSEKEYKMRFWGPTKAEISLVWLIGRGNANIRKGGDR